MARANPLFDIAVPAQAPTAAAPANALAQLSRMHVEAVETAKLANLLGRSLYATITLAMLGLLVLGAGGDVAPTTAWIVLMGVAVLALARTYRHAMAQPFERAGLQAFAQDLSACLLYAGFAWGAGAFLALPAATPAGGALLFATAPVIVIAALLRERQPVLFFLAPVAALTSLACVMRPFADGAMAAGLVLLACAVVAVALQLATQSVERRQALPGALIAS